MDLLPLLVVPITLTATFLVRTYNRHRARHAAKTTEDRCVSCESGDLTVLATSVYRCNACGYEGGEGRAAVTRTQREASFLEMEPAQRMASARQDLLEARRLTLSGLGDLKRAEAFELVDRRTETPDRDHAEASGTGRLLEARNRLRDAAAKLGLSLPGRSSLPYRALIEPTSLIADDGEREELRALLQDFIADDAGLSPGAREGKAMLRAIKRVLKRLSEHRARMGGRD